jgi:trehalose 6-phosphate synthase complex regulatory subunit
MLCAADALVITSLREGWNLTSHEYVVCQHNNGHHPLLLSEFVGSASVFTDAAILVNPWDIKGMADAIHQALSMSPHEADIRWERAFHHVKTHDATMWVTGFLNELKHAYIEQQRGVPTVIPKLHMETYVHNYTQSDKRLFLLDYEGMLFSLISLIIRHDGCLVEWTWDCFDYDASSRFRVERSRQ